MIDGVALERLPDVAGLPAFAAPLDEPWLYDGRIVLSARRRATSAQRTIASRSSTRRKTSEPSDERDDRGDREVDDVGGVRRVPAPERVPERARSAAR